MGKKLIKRKILTIDDNEDDLYIISNTLTNAGYEVAQCTSAHEAIKKLETYYPDCIIVDSKMPQMSGAEFVSIVKSTPNLVYIPIIMLTAMAGTQNIVDGINAGADDYLSKSAEDEIVLVKLKAMLRLGKLQHDILKLNASKEQFLAVCSHDMRSPSSTTITIIKNILKKEKNLSEETLEMLNMVLHHSKFTLSLVDNLLLMGKLEDSHLVLDKTKTDLYVHLKELIHALTPEFERKNLVINYSYNLNDKVISIDKLRIQEAFTNLITNAITYSDEGGVINIEVSEEIRENKKYASISVQDNGIGMSQEQLKTIFDRYEGSTKINKKSIGLGLAITKELCILHDGSVEVTSEPKKGSKFSMLIPLNPES
jgi:signal transduction histidine kinase